MARLVSAAVALGFGDARAQPTGETTLPATTAAANDAEIGDQLIGAAIGVALGNSLTPGGLRATGHYLYQLSARDWFDGRAAFTLGGGSAGCFRNRQDVIECDHGAVDGASFEIVAAIRRMLPAQNAFRPFVELGIGASYVRYAKDNLSGFALPIHVGGGVRARVSSSLAIIGAGELVIGLGSFGRGLGLEAQLGLAVTGGVEFRLK